MSRRRLWLGVLVTCFALTLAQTHNRLVQYVSIPISTTVRYLRNDSLLFPSVTLCPYRDSLYAFFDRKPSLSIKKLTVCIGCRVRGTSHLNITALRQLHDRHFGANSFSDPVSAMYRLADVYDVATLWNSTAWDLNLQISSVSRTQWRRFELRRPSSRSRHLAAESVSMCQ